MGIEGADIIHPAAWLVNPLLTRNQTICNSLQLLDVNQILQRPFEGKV